MIATALRLRALVLYSPQGTSRILSSALIALSLLAVGAVAGRAVDAEYTNRALPGVMVGGVPVGSLDAVALRARLTDAIAEWRPSAIEVRSDDRVWLASDESLGLEPDLDAAMSAALTYGKDGPLALRVASWAKALTGGAPLALPLHSSGSGFVDWVETVAASAEHPMREGTLSVDAGGVHAVAPEIGRYVDRVALAKALGAASGSSDRRLVLPVRAVYPSTDATLFAASVASARAALAPFRLSTSAGGAIAVDSEALGSLVSVRRTAVAPRDVVAVEAGAFAPAERVRFVLTIDEDRLPERVATFAAALDKPARDAGYALRSNGTFAVLPAQDGSTVDRTALAAALRQAVVDPGAPRAVTIATTPVAPQFGTAQAERDVQILTRVGFAEHYYPGEGQRATPIADLLLPPGGRVAGDALPPRAAEVLFAAARAAGYPADGRAPSWRNDTQHPILARSLITPSSVAWELWGVPRARQVITGAPAGR